MKIVITGKNGYVGTHIRDRLVADTDESYEVELMGVRNPVWRSKRLNDTDILIHPAGIVHQPQNHGYEEYKRVNVDLTYELAVHAKECGVSQFIFISSMAVYGAGKTLPSTNYITEDTPCNPTDFYGRSKLEAEAKLLTLQDESFRIAVIRAPNIYGPQCKGGYISGFTKIVAMSPVLPKAYENVFQSMLYIDNLSELVRLLIGTRKSGIYMPQDDHRISSVGLMSEIAGALGKKRRFSRILGKAVKPFEKSPVVKKVYGGVAYDRSLSVYKDMPYNKVSFQEAVRKTIVGK